MSYIFIILIIGFIAVYLVWEHPYLFTAVRKIYFKGRTWASIFDGRDFPSRIIENSVAVPWEKAESYNQSELPSHLLTHLNKTETVSFLVVKNGKLCYENYWRGNNKDSKTHSFSMAKSITVMLLGNAIQNGKIKSIEVKLSELYPEFKDDPNAQYCTLRHLATMQSGLDWIEDYSDPFKLNAQVMAKALRTLC